MIVNSAKSSVLRLLFDIILQLMKLTKYLDWAEIPARTAVSELEVRVRLRMVVRLYKADDSVPLSDLLAQLLNKFKHTQW